MRMFVKTRIAIAACVALIGIGAAHAQDKGLENPRSTAFHKERSPARRLCSCRCPWAST